MFVVIDPRPNVISSCVFEGPLDDLVPLDIEMSLRSQLRLGLDLKLDFSRIESLTQAGMRWVRLLRREAESLGCRVQAVAAQQRNSRKKKECS